MRSGRKKQKRAFDESCMRKSRPKMPRCICGSNIKYMLGIASPSLYQLTAAGYFGEEKAQQLEEFEFEFARFQCWERKLTKKGWKRLQNEARRRRKEGKT